MGNRPPFRVHSLTAKIFDSNIKNHWCGGSSLSARRKVYRPRPHRTPRNYAQSLIVHVNRRNGPGKAQPRDNRSDPRRFRVRFGTRWYVTQVCISRSPFTFFRASMTNRVRASPATTAHHTYRVLAVCARPNGRRRYAFVRHGYTPCANRDERQCG